MEPGIPMAKSTVLEIKPLKVRAVNFSFSFILWLAINFLFLTMGVVYSIFVLKETFETFEKTFLRQGENLSQSLLAILQSHSLKKREDFAKFSEILQKVSQKTDIPYVEEIFILDKVGRVLAHSDFTQISPKARKLVDEIHPRYHKDFFHSALNLKDGQIQVSHYEESKPIFVKSILLKFFPAFQKPEKAYFSTPLFDKNGAFATLHVLLSRQIFTDKLLWLEKKIIFFSGLFVLFANVLWGIFVFAFAIRVNFLEKLWKEHFIYLMENSLLKQELQKKLMDSNAVGFEPKKRVLPSQKEVKEPVDAILLEE